MFLTASVILTCSSCWQQMFSGTQLGLSAFFVVRFDCIVTTNKNKKVSVNNWTVKYALFSQIHSSLHNEQTCSIQG